jgi:hypothetical protein
MRELRRYLGSSETFNLIVGTRLDVELDANRYAPAIEVWYQAEPQQKKPGVNPDNADAKVGTQGGRTKVLAVDGTVAEGRIKFAFNETQVPGAYHIVVTLSRFKVTDKTLAGLRDELNKAKVPDDQQKEILSTVEKLKNQEFTKHDELTKEVDKIIAGTAAQDFKGKIIELAKTSTEERTYVCNVDTMAEGDLRRARPEDLEKNNNDQSPDRSTIMLLVGQRMHPKDPRGTTQGDLSESAWMYGLLLLILVLEQAFAVYLSFHLKGGEAPLATTLGSAPSRAA